MKITKLDFDSLKENKSLLDFYKEGEKYIYDNYPDGATEEEIEEALAKCSFIFVEEENVPIGFIMYFSHRHSPDDEEFLWAASMYTKPNMRRKGIGRKLIDELRRSDSSKQIKLGVSHDNEMARKFYSKLNMLVEFSLDGFDYLYMDPLEESANKHTNI